MTSTMNRTQARADRRSLRPPVRRAFSNFHGQVTNAVKTVKGKRKTARNPRQAFMVQNPRLSKSITVSGCRSRELTLVREHTGCGQLLGRRLLLLLAVRCLRQEGALLSAQRIIQASQGSQIGIAGG